MRVLLLTAELDLPEAHLLKGLADRGVDLTVLCSPIQRFSEIFTPFVDRVEQLPNVSRFHWGTIKTIRRELEREPFDIIHSLTSRALSNALVATWGQRRRHITYRGTMGHLSFFDPASRLSHLNPRVSRIVAVSEAVRTYLLGLGLPPDRVVTIYKGHDPNWYPASSRADLSAIGVPQDLPVVGCIANMRPVKGVDILLKAAATALELERFRIVLVGEVRDNRIHRLVSRNPLLSQYVHLPGYRPDATRLIGASDVFVMPSRAREGLPKAVIEAMSQGIAPIVTSVGGMPELVENERSGLVVPPSNVEAMANAIVRLVRDVPLAQQLGASARRRIEESFSVHTTVSRMLALYREVSRT